MDLFKYQERYYSNERIHSTSVLQKPTEFRALEIFSCIMYKDEFKHFYVNSFKEEMIFRKALKHE